MINKKNGVILGLCAMCALAGYWLAPEKVKTVETVKVVEKIVKVETEQKDVKRDRDTETIIIEHPDGTKETRIKETEVTEDKSRRDSSELADKTTDETKRKIVSKGKKNWLISAGVGVKANALDTQIIIGSVQRRILGEIYLGAWGNSQGQFGVGLTVGF